MPERTAPIQHRRALLAAAVLVAALPVLPGFRTPAHASSAWLTRLNAVRAQAGLRPVADEDRLEQGLANHARYIVKTDDYRHDEDPDSAYYTPSGDAAGSRSNMTVRAGGAGTEVDDVDQWLAAPFHALGLLHPQLTGTSYASYYEAGSPGYTYAAALDVLSFREGRDSADYPVVFPADGMVVPVTMTTVADEAPNSLAPCGYSQPAGLPVIVTFGPTVAAPVVTSYSLTRDGKPVEACATTAGDYADPTARAALDANHTVLLIPRAPLTPGSGYTARVTASGITQTVSFSVARTPSSVAIELSKDDVDCGGTLEVFARLDPGYGSAAKQPLQLWGRGTSGGRSWQLLATRVTNAEGRTTFGGVRPGGNSEYQVRFAGNPSNLPSRSGTRAVAVRPLPWTVTTEQPEYAYVMADSMLLAGNTGVGGFARLGLQEKLIDGGWVQVENVSGTADADGYYEMSVPLGRPGRFVYRVVAYASGCHRFGASDEVVVLVVAESPGT